MLFLHLIILYVKLTNDNLCLFTINQNNGSDKPNASKKKQGNAYNQVTMLTPEDPASRVVMNETGKKIKKKLKRGGKTYEIAPGEGKVCSYL